MNRNGWMRAAVLAAGIGCLVGTAPGRASAAEDAGWRVGAVVATALYAPAKALYAATGLMVGGIGWGLSGGDRGAMDSVVKPAVEGDYLITPEHLRGERRLEFVGRAAAPLEEERSLAGPAEEGLETDPFGYPY